MFAKFLFPAVEVPGLQPTRTTYPPKFDLYLFRCRPGPSCRPCTVQRHAPAWPLVQTLGMQFLNSVLFLVRLPIKDRAGIVPGNVLVRRLAQTKRLLVRDSWLPLFLQGASARADIERLYAHHSRPGKALQSPRQNFHARRTPANVAIPSETGPLNVPGPRPSHTNIWPF